MKYLEYIDRTLLLKKQLDKIVRSSKEWSEIVDLVQKNELLFKQFKKINGQLDEKISKYQTGSVGIDWEEIVEFNGLLADTSFKLNNIQPFLSTEKPNDDLSLEGDLKPKVLFNSWEKSLNYVRNDMKLNEIDVFQNKLECLVETSSKLVLILKRFNDNRDLVRNYDGFCKDLKGRYSNCDELLESDMFVDEMNSAVEMLHNIFANEKEIQREFSTLENGRFSAKSLVNRWRANDKVIKNSMKIKDVEKCSEASLTLLNTAKNLLSVKSTITKNEATIGNFLGIESEMENEFNECYTMSHSEEFSVKLSNILEGLERNNQLEQVFKKRSSIVSEKDKSKIENLFEHAHNEITSDQLNTHNSKLENLISAIPVKYQNRKVLMTKIALGIVAFIIFATLMTVYVVPFFDGLGVNSTVPESKGSNGFLVWIAPLVLSVLVILYNKKIIFK